MDAGYHVFAIPSSYYEKQMVHVSFDDGLNAFAVAKCLSAYNHKTTQVVYFTEDTSTPELIWSFIDGEEVKVF